MRRISVLPQHIANQIAAGEVVERPASVVKELVENSIDAGATQLTIAIKNGGLDMISVTDNGHGMDFHDARLSFERHATSKITVQDDLEMIGTLGFRGEALASICSIAHATIMTKEQGALKGTICKNVGSEIIEHAAIGCPVGTKIVIEQLFYNTPARRKHIKTVATEFSHISEIIMKMALSFTGVGFKLLHNDQVAFDVPARQSLADRIRILIGSEFAAHLLPLSGQEQGLSLSGFVAKPSVSRNSRKQQYLFVNKRPVQNPIISRAIADAFHSLLPSNRHPLFVLFLEIDPREVDVNVHPRKMEVRFTDQQAVFRFIRTCCKLALESFDLKPEISFGNPHRPLTGEFKKYMPPRSTNHESSEAISSGMPQRMNFQRTSHVHMPSLPATKLRPVAQIAESYIVAHDEEGITIIDQHAAHERITYTHLMKALEGELDGKAVSQKLLIPTRIDIPVSHIPLLESNHTFFQKIGFEIDHFGGSTYLIQAVPERLVSLDVSEVFLGVLDNLADKNTPKDIEIRREKVLTYIACKTAIKFGRILTYDEQVSLIAQLEALGQQYTCPHGRPTMIRLSYHELEKKFDRS